MTAVKNRPVVLVIAGNDPSGGAGIQADIQAITAAGAHPAPVISALTVQDTRDAYELRPVDPELVQAQASQVLADLQVRAVKLDLLANSGIAAAVATLLAQAGTVPVVLDPVRVAAGGGRLAEADLLQSLLDKLVPAATIITPNATEIRALAPTASDHAARARILTGLGADNVLVKGGDEDLPDVVNTLFDGSGEIHRYVYPRLPHSYHGSGCTLASAIAARLALGLSVLEAVASAQDYTFETLRRSYKKGGASIVQYRDKRADHRRRLEQARKLRSLCAKSGVLFIVNDDIDIAARTGADGVHLGTGDPGIAEARRQLGEKAVIGASCYDSVERARAAIDEGADYVAFDSVYPSPSKSNATRVGLDTIVAARVEFRLPIACIGGITADNAQSVVDAGADMLAVSSGVFGQPDITAAAQNLPRLFDAD